MGSAVYVCVGRTEKEWCAGTCEIEGYLRRDGDWVVMELFERVFELDAGVYGRICGEVGAG